MSRNFDSQSGLSLNDRALIDEAVRRVQRSRRDASPDPAALIDAMTTAMRQGRRDLFGLVKAGSRIA